MHVNTTRTLLLSAGYEPIKIISWQQAMILMTLTKVEVINEYDADVHSPSVTVKVPSVVRLKKSFRRHRNQVRFSRANIYTRDAYRCQYCGTKCTIAQLTFDHVMPRSRGGRTSWENIVTCCIPCNARKSNRTPAEAKMKLLTMPVRPNWMPSVSVSISTTSVPDAWRDYVYWTGDIDGDEPTDIA